MRDSSAPISGGSVRLLTLLQFGNITYARKNQAEAGVLFELIARR